MYKLIKKCSLILNFKQFMALLIFKWDRTVQFSLIKFRNPLYAYFITLDIIVKRSILLYTALIPVLSNIKVEKNNKHLFFSIIKENFN